MVQAHTRVRIPIILAVLALLLCLLPSGVSASGNDQSSLSAEADTLTFGSAQSIGLDGVKWAEFEILIPGG